MKNYTLNVSKADNGWIIHCGTDSLVVKDDEELAGTIAAALVAGRLQENAGPQATVFGLPVEREVAHYVEKLEREVQALKMRNSMASQNYSGTVAGLQGSAQGSAGGLGNTAAQNAIAGVQGIYGAAQVVPQNVWQKLFGGTKE